MITDLYKKLKSLNIKISLVGLDLNIEAPKGTLTPTLINEIKFYKKELIDLIQEYQNYSKINQAYQSTISALPNQMYYNTSYRQKREWIFFQNGICNNLFYIKKINNIQLEEFKGAIHDLVERHEALRTYFIIHENELKQIIHPKNKVAIHIHNIEINEQHEMIELEKIKKEAENNLFNLSTAPLFKIMLVNKKYIIFNIHHIIIDEWSMEIIIREFNLFYENRVKRENIYILPNLSIQYKDYVAHQNNWLESNEGIAAENYWKAYFSHPLPEIPWNNICHHRPDFTNGYFVAYENGNTYKFFLDKNSTMELRSFSANMNISFFSVLMSSFILLVYKTNLEKDVIISCPITDRDVSTTGVVGWMMKGLILRTKIQDEITLATFLNEVFENYVNSAQHCAYPIGKLKMTSLSSSCSMGINYINMESTLKEIIDNFSPVHNEGGIPYYPINVKIFEKFNGIEFNIIYRNDMFSKKIIENLFNTHLQILFLLIKTSKNKSIKDFLNNLDLL